MRAAAGRGAAMRRKEGQHGIKITGYGVQGREINVMGGPQVVQESRLNRGYEVKP